MFDKLEDILLRFEEIMNQLSEPDVANDTNRFRKLMKEQSDLAPIVEAYKEYKQEKQNIEDSLAMLEEESDEEMRELAKEELSGSPAPAVPGVRQTHISSQNKPPVRLS